MAEIETFVMKAYLYIRFSSKRQAKGNSVDRQVEWGRAWCHRRGVALDDTLAIADLGRSGRGRRDKREGLQTFLNACKEGRVKRGNYLIVENLDRLSREHPLDAMDLVRTLLRDYGIVIVTIKPESELSATNLDMVAGVLMYIELARGHGESQRKSEFQTDNWDRLRRAAVESGGVRKMTRKVPSWVVAVGEGDAYTFRLDDTKADVVRHVFKWCIKGFGSSSIARRLNRDKVPHIGRAAVWHASYVEKLLNSRSVLGECQPMRLDGDKRIPVGEPIKDYFPRVISGDDFADAHRARASRRNRRGLVTSKVTNLFTHLVHQDGEAMAIRPAGRKNYLQSASGQAEWVRYEPFEQAFLLWVREAALPLGDGVDRAALARRQGDLDKRIKTLSARIDDDADLADLLDKLAEMKRELKKVTKELDEAAIPSEAHLIHSRQLLKMLAECADDERESLRRQLRQTIRHVVSRIDVRVEKARRQSKTQFVYLTVMFRDGSRRGVWYITKQGKLYQAGLWRGHDDTPDKPAIIVTTEESVPVWLVGEDTKGDRIRRIKALREEGLSYQEIASEMGVGRVTVYKWLRDAAFGDVILPTRAVFSQYELA